MNELRIETLLQRNVHMDGANLQGYFWWTVEEFSVFQHLSLQKESPSYGGNSANFLMVFFLSFPKLQGFWW